MFLAKALRFAEMPPWDSKSAPQLSLDVTG
jgi:hypothetical protein